PLLRPAHRGHAAHVGPAAAHHPAREHGARAAGGAQVDAGRVRAVLLRHALRARRLHARQHVAVDLPAMDHQAVSGRDEAPRATRTALKHALGTDSGEGAGESGMNSTGIAAPSRATPEGVATVHAEGADLKLAVT